jgi:hypothetical protein
MANLHDQITEFQELHTGEWVRERVSGVPAAQPCVIW